MGAAQFSLGDAQAQCCCTRPSLGAPRAPDGGTPIKMADTGAPLEGQQQHAIVSHEDELLPEPVADSDQVNDVQRSEDTAGPPVVAHHALSSVVPPLPHDSSALLGALPFKDLEPEAEACTSVPDPTTPATTSPPADSGPSAPSTRAASESGGSDSRVSKTSSTAKATRENSRREPGEAKAKVKPQKKDDVLFAHAHVLKAPKDELPEPLAKPGAKIQVELDTGWADWGEHELKQSMDHFKTGARKFAITVKSAMYIIDFTDFNNATQTNPHTQKSRRLRVVHD